MWIPSIGGVLGRKNSNPEDCYPHFWYVLNFLWQPFCSQSNLPIQQHGKQLNRGRQKRARGFDVWEPIKIGKKNPFFMHFTAICAYRMNKNNPRQFLSSYYEKACPEHIHWLWLSMKFPYFDHMSAGMRNFIPQITDIHSRQAFLYWQCLKNVLF